MGNFVDLFYKKEIRLLVLLSFTLQMFLFFTGALRRRKITMAVRFSMWLAYLGADLVAVYALGYLSQHEDVSIELAFFWAPFLLIHLGVQDNVTAFSMEDNGLWLRHLLNLVVQVVLVLYIFWKYVGRHNMDLLVSGILVFVTGVIKYGERAWSLRYGNFKNLESSAGHHYKQWLPEEITDGAQYSDIVCTALHSMMNVLNIFAGRSLLFEGSLAEGRLENPQKMIKVVRLELGLMYDDLYTKALVLRTRSGIILRWISQVSMVAASALFHASHRGGYRKFDIAITYSLFIGSFFLEVCGIFILMMSPWTWAWLKVRNYDRLANLSLFLFSSNIGWPEKKPQWPNSIGQYNLLSWLDGKGQTSSCNQRVMTMIRNLMDFIGFRKEKLFGMSKLLDTEYEEADEMTMECVAQGIRGLRGEFSREPREWPNITPLLERIHTTLVGDFGLAIVQMHIFTELHLNKYTSPARDMGANAVAADSSFYMVKICRKLSVYMMYLLVNHPSMLPLNISAAALLEECQKPEFSQVREILYDCALPPSKETLEEMVDMWTRLLLFAAGRSKAEMHAAQLGRGGELITFAWLLMAHYGLGDSNLRRIRIANAPEHTNVEEVFAFYVPAES